MIPNDRAAIILTAVFGDAEHPAYTRQHHPPTDRAIPFEQLPMAPTVPRQALLEALAQIHQQPVGVIEEAFL